MGLIIEESKCKFERSIEILSKREYDNIEKAYAFAETELQNLAIEFAAWTQDSSFKKIFLLSEWVHKNGGSKILTTKQLFEIFIDQRKTN